MIFCVVLSDVTKPRADYGSTADAFNFHYGFTFVRLVLQTLSVWTLLAFVFVRLASCIFIFVWLGLLRLLPSFSKGNYFFSTDSKSSWNRKLD